MSLESVIELAYEFDDLPKASKDRPEVVDLYKNLMAQELGFLPSSKPKVASVARYGKQRGPGVTKAKIHQIVIDNPGICSLSIAEKIGMDRTNVNSHLKSLMKCDKVVRQRQSVRYLYYPA